MIIGPPDGLLSAIVRSADEAIIAKTLDGTIISWNAAAERLYGYTAEEAVGQPIGLIAPEDRPDEMAELLARIARGERIDHFETVRKRKDGSLVDVSVTISPVFDRGTIVGASAIARDLTRQKREGELARRRALEIHDEIVQGLVILKMALETGDRPLGDRTLERTLASAKRIVADFLSGIEITAEELRVLDH